MSSLRETEAELFTVIKTRLLPEAKRDTTFGNIAADALLMITVVEQLNSNVLRTVFTELISLIFLSPKSFFAVANVIKLAIMMGGDNEEE